MRKTFLFALILSVFGTNIALGALADGCYHKYSNWYGVYFDTAKYDKGAGCAAQLKSIGEEIAAQKAKDDTLEVWLIASADTQGRGSYNNEKLSNQRLNYVNGAFAKSGLVDRVWTTGDVSAFNSGSSGSDEEYRAVYVLVLSKSETPPNTTSWIELKSGLSMDISGSATSTWKVGTEEGKVAALVARIGSLSANLDVSKWKDKNGNFNTARLASDSIAGVVLGTAGGLITSNVIKKNQLSSGFGDIHCTIGGQVVADYGDEFIVGVR